ncbi:MAG: succinylglutamate desuccinylase/aspartoacylase family protein [Saprospiraceae bacterium]|nr:succinylglutamate desuccinylase/aspartoacylase family protein [Saprospiraceae bacterium]
MSNHKMENDFLTVVEVKGKFDGPHLLVIAGVHGDEYEPMEACRRLFKEIESKKDFLRGRLTCVPVVNRGAFQHGSRTGSDQLDLARTCPGRPDGSETEKAAYAVSQLIQNCDFLVDMHNGGRTYNISPLSGYVLHPDVKILEQQRMMSQAFGLPISWGTDPTLQGRTLSVARDAGVPAIYTEIGGQGIYHEAYTKLALIGCLNVMHFLKMLDGDDPHLATLHQLEDYRMESGHLQKLLPAPTAGFFLPCVALNDYVEEGDAIGTIQDESGAESLTIFANEPGMIFMLRCIPSVQEGDTLGGILPISEGEKVKSIYE